MHPGAVVQCHPPLISLYEDSGLNHPDFDVPLLKPKSHAGLAYRRAISVQPPRRIEISNIIRSLTIHCRARCYAVEKDRASINGAIGVDEGKRRIEQWLQRSAIALHNRLIDSTVKFLNF
jgi:hypothetical protein